MSGRWAALGVCASLLAACNTDPVRVGVSTVQQHQSREWSGCGVAIGALRDQRRETSNLGRVGARMVLSDDPLAWLRRGLSHYAGKGATLTLHADLLLLYVQSQASSKSAQIAMHVRYQKDAQPLLDRTYRGRSTSMNWANGDIEIQEALDRALSDMLTQVEADLRQICASSTDHARE